MSARVGVCSWSLRPATPEELVARLHACGVDAVQLALDPLRTESAGAWGLEATRAALARGGLRVLSGMMGMRGEDYSSLASIRRTGGVAPDEHWQANLAAARENARLARALKLDLVSFHAGFLPEDPAAPERATLTARLRELVDVFAAEGVRTAFESGQERAATLLAVLDELERPAAGVNFDPANMILYDKDDPVDALRALAPRVLQIHVKDARRTTVLGEWGREVAVGKGEVRWDALFEVYRTLPMPVDLVIEREAGATRSDDVRAAKELVELQLAGDGATG